MGRMTVEIDVPELEQTIQIDPKRTAFLLIDIQNESCHPDGKNYTNADVNRMLDAVNALIGRAREHSCEVIWMQSVRRPDQPVFSVFGVEPYRLEGTWNVEFAAPLVPADGEPVFKKYSHDCFYETGLSAYLAERGIAGPEWTVVVVGVSYVGCVFVAVTGLSHRDFRVVIPIDCVAPNSGDRASITMARLAHRSYAYNVHQLESSLGLEFVR